MKELTVYDSQTNRIDDLDPSVLPPQSKDFLTAYAQRDRHGEEHVSLEVGPYVGILPLLDGSTLYIAPRVGYPALSRMVTVAERLDESVNREFEKFAELGYDDTDGSSKWTNLLARSFTAQLQLIKKNSLRTDRKWKQLRLNTVRGRVQLVPTTLHTLADRANPVSTLVKTKSFETVENRFLAAGAQTLLNLNLVSGDAKKILIYWASMLDKKPLTESELVEVNKNIAAGYYVGSRSYYIPALVMARLILLQGSVSFEGLKKVRSEAVLTNVYALFETYLRVLLRREFTDQGYIVEKLEAGVPSLFTDGTAELKPDIIMSVGSQAKLLLDAKYKLNAAIENPDYFQMKTYLDVYDLQQGVIVRPSAIPGNTHVARKMFSGKIIHEITLDLRNWQEAESFLLKTVKDLL